MKRYLLFGGEAYYPGGGFLDYQESRATLIEIRDVCKYMRTGWDWYHIVDSEMGKIIVSGFKSRDIVWREEILDQ